MKANKYYAVKNGRQTGIFTTWAECQKQTVGFSNAQFKSFLTLAEAEAYMNNTTAKAEVNSEAVAYVDGSFNSAKGIFGCGVVFLYNGSEKYISESFDDKSLADMHNVAGEIMGAIRAMELCLEKGIKSLTIYFDYNGIEKWASGEWKTNRDGTAMYKKFCDSVSDRLTVSFVKVKSHSGDKYNDMADALAKKSVLL